MNKNTLLALLLGLLIIVAAIMYAQPQLITGLFDKQAPVTTEVKVVATSTPAEATPMPPKDPTTRTITKADDGKMIKVRRGSTVVLSLGFDKWTVKIGDGGAISLVKKAPLVGGSQAVYMADKEGSTLITATGTTVCGVKVACTPTSVKFSTTVMVIN